MRAAILSALLFFTACGPPPDLVSKHGTKIWLNGATWTRESIEEQEAGFISRLDAHSSAYPKSKTIEALKFVTVDIEPSFFECVSSHTGFCNGLQIGSHLRVRDFGCVDRSAYTHELFHWFQWFVHNENDFNHVQKHFWTIADSGYVERNSTACE